MREEVHSAHQLHGEKPAPALLDEVTELDQVRVLQPLERAKLLLDVEDGAGVEAAQGLQGDVRAVLAIEGLVDHPHAAGPEAPDDLEAGRPAEITLVGLHAIRTYPPPAGRRSAEIALKEGVVEARSGSTSAFRARKSFSRARTSWRASPSAHRTFFTRYTRPPAWRHVSLSSSKHFSIVARRASLFVSKAKLTAKPAMPLLADMRKLSSRGMKRTSIIVASTLAA